MNRFVRLSLGLLAISLGGLATAADESAGVWHAGFSRVDVTPVEPVRMSGYGSRDRPSEGIDTPLYARSFALRPAAGGSASVLVSVDNIGLPGALTRQLAQDVEQAHGIPRDNLVFCSTHTHCGPDLVRQLSNIFATPLSEQEAAAGKRYRQQLVAGIRQSIAAALAGLAPAKLHYAVGEASFAANRRVLTGGRWTGFGVQSDGPVDHTVPTLRITDANDKLRGVVFNYACHCTTLGGNHYRINGEWAGYAATSIEADHPQAVALCTIGCGGDANPEPRGSLDATKVHGRTLAAEVNRIIQGKMKEIDAPLDVRFDYAALTFDLPTQEQLQQRTSDTNPQTRRHAEQLLDVLKEHGRLPATYPVPIQSWRFGDQLTMIFLGGEVVVDYAIRLKRELEDPELWVTAYANDVMGYIASERIRGEGGYEYDRSGIYYGLPGPWASGTEDRLVARVRSMLASRGRSRPIPADKSLQQIQPADGYQIELIASDPLVQDPINMAFDGRGRMWVVEMGDYPEGDRGGRVKVLSDDDGDGRYDRADLFLSDLSFPTGVLPWRDGVLVSVAPDIIFARDTNGDGHADQIEKLYTGFRLANPQHRISGFSYGLDHSLHLASGDNLGQLTSVKTGQTVNASGHDVQIWPEHGRIAVTSGRTQYVRSRNDWGQWFGNDNSRPMYHFPIDDRYLRRNSAIGYSGGSQQLFDPPVAPPVFPITLATERFNDLFAANRFTSACSAIVARSPLLAVDSQHDVALICEPVHNLIHRSMLVPSGASYRAERWPQESNREFIASSDPWFRPVRALIGPDGHLYVADMYRETIEHPEWIPESWQSQLDLRAGADRGRIYRVSPTDANPQGMAPLDRLSTSQLVDRLRSPIGPMRDLAQQLIIERDDDEATPLLVGLAQDSGQPRGRVHALSILHLQQRLQPAVLLSALEDSHPGVLMVAIGIAESSLESDLGSAILQRLAAAAAHREPRVLLATALALGQTKDPRAGRMLADIVCSSGTDPWVARAVSSSAKHHAATILADLLINRGQDAIEAMTPQLLTDLLVTAQQNGTDIASEYSALFSEGKTDVSTQLKLAASFTAAIQSNQTTPDQLAKTFAPLYDRATALALDADQEEQQRCAALQLIGIGMDSAQNEKTLLLDLLSPSTPVVVQHQAIDRLSRFPESETCRDLIERWSSMSDSVRNHCVSRMLQRRNWTEELLDALESNTIQAKDLTPASRQQLTRTGSRSMRVRAQRLTSATTSMAKRELVTSYLSQLAGERKIDNGAALFKQHCAVCHVSDDRGQAVGASLDNLTDRSDQALVTAILDPNRAVDPKYQSYVIHTDDDRVLVGTIENEAGQSITLAHADGRRTTLRRSQIAGMKNSGVSLMPEGLESVLSPAAMRDLAGYLQTRPTRP